MNILTIDLETTYTQSKETGELLASGITHPKTLKKQETIDKWVTEKKPAAIADAVHKTALSATFGEITCICFAFNDADIITVSRKYGESERDMLQNFWGRIAENKSRERATIVGYNVMFDYEFLRIRSIILGVKPPIYMPAVKPWDKSIYDVKENYWGNSVPVTGLKHSLANTAKALGIDGKYNGIDGSLAPQMWIDGKDEELTKYCAQDVEMTREIYKRINYIDTIVRVETNDFGHTKQVY